MPAVSRSPSRTGRPSPTLTATAFPISSWASGSGRITRDFSIPIRTVPPVLYAYLTRRNPKAPGGAEFVPELIHNQSGAGSQILATDHQSRRGCRYRHFRRVRRFRILREAARRRHMGRRWQADLRFR